jgi:nitroreductase
MNERNPVETDVIPQIHSRWSPYELADRPVEPAKLKVLFDAARWAANSYNEQPWRYIIATKEQPADYAKLLGCLVEANQAWAKHAPVLMLSFAKRTFTRGGKPNRVAVHDVGAASAQLTLQAEALGLHVHQMAGIEIGKIQATYGVPDDFEPVAALAVGYPGHNPNLDPDIRQRDQGPRTRKPFADFVFTGAWGKPSDLVK